MITEVYINDQLIDIEDDVTVAASYGNISFGEFQKRKGVKSNTWQAPFSPRNKTVFEGCEVVGSYSTIPYRKATIRVEIHGVIVFEGFAVINSAKTGYEIISFAGASDFYNIINGRKCADMDLSAYTHYWSEVNQRASWNNTQGYIYAYVYQGRLPIDIPIPPDFLLPHIFFHSVIKQIAIDAGYTLMGDVLTNQRFLKHIIICNKFPMPVIYGGEIVLSQLLHDMAQSKLWLDFANIYGLQFDIDDVNKTIRANYIDDLLFNEPEEWTSKVDKTDKPTTTYSLGYGQNSYLKFNTDDVCTQAYEKEIDIDDNTLEQEKDVYKSPYFLIQHYTEGGFIDGIDSTFSHEIKNSDTVFRGAWNDALSYGGGAGTVKEYVWHNGTYYLATAIGTNHEPPNPTYWKVGVEKDIWTVKGRPMYGRLVTDPFSLVEVIFAEGNEQVTRIINRTQLDWPTSYTLHYRVFRRIIDKTKKVEGLIKLNYADVNQLDFTRLKRIDNELYLVEEVKQFKLNKRDSTLVDLIRL